MDKQPKKQNNKAGRLLLMAVLAVIVIYAGARFTQSPQQPAAIAPAESAQPISGGLTLLTEPPAESAQPEAGAQPEAPVQQDAPEAPAETPPAESGSYTEVEDVAYYLHTYGHLPDNYMTKSEAEDAGICAVAPHQVSGEPGGVAQQHDEQTGGVWVERAAVADLDKVEVLLYGLYQVVRRDVYRLVHEQDAVQLRQPRYGF